MIAQNQSAWWIAVWWLTVAVGCLGLWLSAIALRALLDRRRLAWLS